MATANFATVTAGLPFGWQLLWGIKIEGFPQLFVERDLGAVDPTGYTAEEALIVDDSSKLGGILEKKSGIGKAYDLIFHLERTTVTKALFRRPARITYLTASVTDTETTVVNVGDASSWPSSGVFYVGREAIGYAFKTATTLNGLTRGSPNSEWRAYQHDIASGLSTWVTDAPLFWRGRLVELYAIPVDPYGAVQGSDMLDGASMVWKGHIQTKPLAYRDGWTLSCRSIDRRLTEKVGVKASGQGRFEMIADPLTKVDTTWAVTFDLEYDVAGAVPRQEVFTLKPFATGYIDGEQIRLSEAREAIRTTWATVTSAFAAASKVFIKDELFWNPDDQFTAIPDGVDRQWRARYLGSTNRAAGFVGQFLSTAGGHMEGLYVQSNHIHPAAEVTPGLGWIQTDLLCFATNEISSIVITLDKGSVTDLPATGYVVFEVSNQRYVYEYESFTVLAAESSEIQLQLAPHQLSIAQLTKDYIDGGAGTFDVSFGHKLGPDSCRDLMRTMLQSGGRGDNGTFDTEPRGAGYDLDVIDEDSFDLELDGPWVSALTDQEFMSDSLISFVSVWGSLMSLSQRAVVAKQATDGSAVELTVVQTSLADTGLATLTITDADLLVMGGGSSPVRERTPTRAPNSITVKPMKVAGQKDGEVVINDIVSIYAEGLEKWSMTTYGLSRSQLVGPATTWAASRFEDQRLTRIYEFDVVPWLAHDNGDAVDIGDAINIDSSHFMLFDAETGEAGYSGPGRVIGRQVGVKDYAMTLTVAIAGTYNVVSLAPSAQVVSTVPAVPTAAPTTIRIAGDYYDLMVAFLGAGPSFDLIAYEPSSDDATTDGVTVSGVVLAGGLTELTISAVTGAPTFTADWFLTIPIRGSSNAAQAKHLHEDTPGAVWR